MIDIPAILAKEYMASVVYSDGQS